MVPVVLNSDQDLRDRSGACQATVTGCGLAMRYPTIMHLGFGKKQ